MRPASRPAWIAAADACRLLGVKPSTLYAYVSRGRVRSQPSRSPSRARLYARADVEGMKRRTEERREPGKAAARALTWGMPVLESAITLIDGRDLYYRGVDATELARSRSLEDVASLIWTGGSAPLPTAAAPPTLPAAAARLPFVGRAQSMLAAAAAHDRRAMDLRPASAAATGAAILRVLLRAAGGPRQGDLPAHRALARAWKLDPPAADLLRAALVLTADHELNVSCFAARCVASAGAHLYAAVIAGLAALEGPRHGGAGARVESLLAAERRTRSLSASLAGRLRRGESIDGFGHPLYSGGDPRARVLLVLLEALRDRADANAECRYVSAFAAAAGEATGERPNIDFALAALARVLHLPAGSPLVLFAIGRSVGWIGHAIEQHATGQMIRPRAKYVGAAPAAASGPKV